MTTQPTRLRKGLTSIDTSAAYSGKRNNAIVSVIKPRAGRNLIRNGAFRRTWRYWDVAGQAFVNQLDYGIKRNGPYGLRTQVISGTFEPFLRCVDPALQTWVAGQSFVLTFWIYTSHAPQVRLSFSPADAVVIRDIQPRRWNRVRMPFKRAAGGSGDILLGCLPVTSADATGHYMVLSELQLESGSSESTFIDGAAFGPGVEPGDFFFSGTEGDSQAARSESAARGGEVVNLAAFGFSFVDIEGLGIGEIEHSTIDRASGGSTYQGSSRMPQSFTIIGDLVGKSPRDLADKRRALFETLSPWRTGQPRPVVLRIRFVGEAGEDSRDVDVVCTFDEGLSAGIGGGERQERLALSFTTHEPAVMRPEVAGAALFGWKYASPLLTDGVLRVFNKLTGEWSAPIGGFNNINGITADGAGNFWIYGFGTSLGGDPNANYIARYNPSTGTLTGFGAAAGASGIGVRGIYVSPSTGQVFVYGLFSQIAGLTTNNLAVYDPVLNTWSAYGSPSGAVYAVAEWRGLMLIGGLFASIGGGGGNILVSHPLNAPLTVFTTITLTLTPTRVDTITVGSDDLVYISGEASAGLQSFIQAWGFLPSLGGTTLGSVLFGGETFSVGGRRIQRAARLKDGRIAYAYDQSSSVAIPSELYATDGTSVSLQKLASLTHVGYPASGTPVRVTGLRVSPNGALSVGVDLQGATAIQSSRAWGNWFDVRSGAVINKQTGVLNTGSTVPSTSSFEEDAGFEVFVNSGPADYVLMPGVAVAVARDLVRPRFVVKGPGTLVCIENYSTGQRIDLNIPLSAGEALTIDCETGVIESSTRGMVTAGVLTISDVIGFSLRPGNNRIGVSLWPSFQANTLNGSPTINRIQIDSVTRSTSRDGIVYMRGTGTRVSLENENVTSISGGASCGSITGSGSMEAITVPSAETVRRAPISLSGWLNASLGLGALAAVHAPVIDVEWPDIIPSLDYAFAE